MYSYLSDITLAKMGLSAIPALLRSLQTGPSRNAQAAVKTLGMIGESAIPALVGALRSGDNAAKSSVAAALSIIGSRQRVRGDVEKSVSALIDFLNSSTNRFDRASAIHALGAMADKAAVPIPIEQLNDEDYYLCACAFRALGRLQDNRAVSPLIGVLTDANKSWVLREAAAVTLGDLGTLAESAIPTLTSALEFDCNASVETWNERARDAVQDALIRIRDPQAKSTIRG
jgi:HEAT repeat protein